MDLYLCRTQIELNDEEVWIFILIWIRMNFYGLQMSSIYAFLFCIEHGIMLSMEAAAIMVIALAKVSSMEE